MKQKVGYVVSLVLVMAMALIGFSRVQAESKTGVYSPPRSLNVSGSGVIKASPDMARIVLGYVNEAKEARLSQENNASVSNEIIRALKGLGIEEKDIQTMEFTITAVYTYQQDREPVIRGYQTTHMLSVAVRDLKNIGSVIDSSTKAGANRIQQISFDIANKENLKLQAIEEAMKDARKKAEAALKAEGESILRVVTVSVDGGWSQPPSPGYRNDLKEGAATPSIQAGELTLTITVQVTYSF